MNRAKVGMTRSLRAGVIVAGLVVALTVVLAKSSLLTAAPRSQAKPSAIDLTAIKALGSRQAPITVEIFSDYECPQCRNLYLTTTHQLIDNYVSTGKVYLVHRDFPLPMHAYAREAARWANAAAEAGQFEPAETVLYTKQDDWSSTGKVELALASAIPPAEMKKIQTIFMTESGPIDASIQRDIDLGNSRHVDGTPTIFVLHRGEVTPLPPGGVSYTLLKQYLDYLLQQR